MKIGPLFTGIVDHLRGALDDGSVKNRVYPGPYLPSGVTLDDCPFAIVYLLEGPPWPATLTAGNRDGLIRLQVTGVGRSHVDALWVCDQLRPVIETGELEVPGYRIGARWSEGPPLAGDSEGTLVQTVERFLVYAEEVTVS